MPLAQDYPTQEDIRKQEALKKLQSEDVELLNRFRSYAERFSRAYNNLVSQREAVANLNIVPLTQEYNLVVDRGSRVGNTIEAVAIGVNNALKALREQWGDDFIENGTAQDILRDTTSVLGAMGLHPAWALAGGIGLTAAVQMLLQWLTEADSMSRKLEAVSRFIEQNPQLSKDEQAQYVQSIQGGQGTNWLMWVLLAGVAYLIFQQSRR